MKLIFVNKFATVTGGADRYALDLARLMSERGHDVRFLAFRPRGEPPFSGRYMMPTVTGESRGSVSPVAAARIAATMVWNRHAADSLKALIEHDRPDVIHIHKIYPQFSISPIVVAGRFGVPVVQRAADFEFISARPEDSTGSWVDHDSALQDRIVNTVSFALRRRWHVPRVTEWVLATDFMKQVYAEFGIEAEAIPHFLTPSEGPLPSFGERRGIAFLGRLVETKGVRDVVELARRCPDIPVTIAGSGSMYSWVCMQAAKLPNLKAPGHLDREAVDGLIGQARIVVVPSRWPEPAGQVALEAMNRGTPVVAYMCGGLSDYVRLNEGGELVEQGNTEALIHSASALYTNRARWEEFSVAGREGIRRNHGSAAHATRVEELYMRAVERASGSSVR